LARSRLAQHHPPVRMNLWSLCNRPFEYPRTARLKGSTSPQNSIDGTAFFVWFSNHKRSKKDRHKHIRRDGLPEFAIEICGQRR